MEDRKPSSFSEYQTVYRVFPYQTTMTHYRTKEIVERATRPLASGYVLKLRS